MSEVLTKTIPVESYTQLFSAQQQLSQIRIPGLIQGSARTDYSGTLEFCEVHKNSQLRFGLKNIGVVALGAIIWNAQAHAENESARTLYGPEVESLLESLTPQKKKYRVATFHEPIRFTWSQDASRIRQAAKQYSEQSNADH